MPDFFRFLRCLGKALVKHGPRALAGLVPMGADLYDAARDALAEYDGNENELRADVQATAQAGPAEVKQAAETIVRQVAADQPAEAQAALATYLTQAPAAMRRSLRRAADPSGKTVPATLALRRPEDLLRLLPPRLPRFKPGDRPLPGVDRELVELLGSGGFGEVWAARNPYQQSDSLVALKFCLDLDKAAMKSLENEAKLLDVVRRDGWPPGLVRLHQTYLSATPPCLEYEYVAGGDLADLVRERHEAGGMQPEEAARLMLQMAQAVAFAHQRGIVHRDLKPANILIERTADGGLRLKVADFGIGGIAAGWALARAGGRQHTTHQDMTEALRGAYSPLYASPQQMRGDPDYRPSPRDDVYALGVIWYQLLTGDLTTGAPSGMRWAKRLAANDVPRSHLALMMACFEADHATRLADATDLGKRLDQLLGQGSPSAAHRAAVPREAQDPWRQLSESPKPKARSFLPLVAWGVAASVLLCVVVGVALWTLTAPGSDTGRHAESGDPTKTGRTGSTDSKKTGRVVPMDSKKTERPSAKDSSPPEQYLNAIGMEFAWIKPGSFTMGSDMYEAEKPVHKVTITKGFYMGVYHVTQSQWQGMMDNNPSRFKGDDRPVENVSWDDCQQFCEKLRKRDGKLYRLPTEAEWEYACRAGTTTDYYSGEGETALKKVGWYVGNSGGETHPVGRLVANEWGLYDMHGNVWEWCQDAYASYQSGNLRDPCVENGDTRILRGGSCLHPPPYCRAAYRSWYAPSVRRDHFGFRVCFCLD